MREHGPHRVPRTWSPHGEQPRAAGPRAAFVQRLAAPAGLREVDGPRAHGCTWGQGRWQGRGVGVAQPVHLS